MDPNAQPLHGYVLRVKAVGVYAGLGLQRQLIATIVQRVCEEAHLQAGLPMAFRRERDTLVVKLRSATPHSAITSQRLLFAINAEGVPGSLNLAAVLTPDAPPRRPRGDLVRHTLTFSDGTIVEVQPLASSPPRATSPCDQPPSRAASVDAFYRARFAQLEADLQALQLAASARHPVTQRCSAM